MALPSVGPISFSQINTELSRSATATLNIGDSAVRSLAGVPSGPIAISSLLGKSSVIVKTVVANANNLLLSGLFTTAEWNAATEKMVVINPGLTIGSTNSGNAALQTGTGGAGKLTLRNNGNILGAGGPGNSGTGGNAIQVNRALFIENNGAIRGGGGGGGVGGNGYYQNYYREGEIFKVYPENEVTQSSQTNGTWSFWWNGWNLYNGGASDAWGPDGWLYHTGTFQFELFGTYSYAIWRERWVNVNTYGGAGGRGRGSDGAPVSGAGGSGANAGAGGWGGEWGNAGNAGANGNTSNGAAGGAAGRALLNANGSAVTWVTLGTINGAR